MHKKIKQLREKPPHVRERVAYTATILVLVVLALFWVWTLNFRFTDETEKSARANSFHPFSILKDSFTDVFTDIKSGVQGESTQFTNTPEDTEEISPQTMGENSSENPENLY